MLLLFVPALGPQTLIKQTRHPKVLCMCRVRGEKQLPTRVVRVRRANGEGMVGMPRPDVLSQEGAPEEH